MIFTEVEIAAQVSTSRLFNIPIPEKSSVGAYPEVELQNWDRVSVDRLFCSRSTAQRARLLGPGRRDVLGFNYNFLRQGAL